MTPLDLARNMAATDDPKAHALAVAIVTRGLTDDSPERAGWPLTAATVQRAADYLDLPRSAALVADALALAPTLSPAILNHR